MQLKRKQKDYKDKNEIKNIKENLSGWKLEIFSIVNDIEKDKFNLDAVYEFKPELKNKYPTNKNIKAKIRQQLQYLRD